MYHVPLRFWSQIGEQITGTTYNSTSVQDFSAMSVILARTTSKFQGDSSPPPKPRTSILSFLTTFNFNEFFTSWVMNDFCEQPSNNTLIVVVLVALESNIFALAVCKNVGLRLFPTKEVKTGLTGSWFPIEGWTDCVEGGCGSQIGCHVRI